MTKSLIRLFDFLFSFLGLILLFPILVIIFIIGLFLNGSPLFKQKRVGCEQKQFILIKFRSMEIETKSAPTHLIDKSKITPFGNFLRRSKFDELPQLFNVLLGEMSLVGPRPCLTNQKKLIIEREKRGVYRVKPGITGLAQISGVNMESPKNLAEIDSKMINNMNLYLYFYYILKTIIFIINKKM